MSMPHQGSIKFYEKFIFFIVHLLHLPNFVTTTIGNYIHIGVQVDTDHLITYHFLEHL